MGGTRAHVPCAVARGRVFRSRDGRSGFVGAADKSCRDAVSADRLVGVRGGASGGAGGGSSFAERRAKHVDMTAGVNAHNGSIALLW